MTSVTADQMREVDRLMVDEMGMSLLQMMENAGRSLAEQACRMLGVTSLGAGSKSWRGRAAMAAVALADNRQSMDPMSDALVG